MVIALPSSGSPYHGAFVEVPGARAQPPSAGASVMWVGPSMVPGQSVGDRGMSPPAKGSRTGWAPLLLAGRRCSYAQRETIDPLRAAARMRHHGAAAVHSFTPRPSDDSTQPGETEPGVLPAELVDQLHRGDTLGRYVVLDRLGVGGMGEVFAAYDPELDRKIAVKLLRWGTDGSRSSSAAERLVREAKAMAKLSHRNVITVHDVGTHEGRVFVAMEFIDGGTLADWLRRGPYPWQTVVEQYLAAGAGLAAAHAHGLIHRDFKPANVLLGSDGRVRVADFGLARRARDSSPELRLVVLPGTSASETDRGSEPTRHGEPLTRTGVMLGTPAYMAPEQYDGTAIDARADQFGFCVALYEALYGERPFDDDNLHARMIAVAAGHVREPPAGSSVPGWLRRVVLRGLAHDPQQRWPDMDTLLGELRRDPVRLRRRRLLASGLGCGLILAGVGVGRHMSAESPEPAVCVGDEQALGAAYDASDRAAIEQSFAALGATATGNELLVALDRWAQDWRDAWLEACRATRVRGDQSEDLLDRRMACLDQRRSQLTAFVDTMATADQDMAGRALTLLGELDPLAACSDRATLLRQVPLPSEPERVAVIQAAQSGLEQVRLLQLAGRPRVAASMLAEQRPLVEQADWGPLTAIYLAAEGWQRLREDRPAEAERLLHRAFTTAISIGDDSLARAIARRVAAAGKDEPERARDSLDWLELAAALAIREGSDDAVLAHLALVRSQILVTLGDHEQARAATEEALERLTRAEPEGTSIGSARYQLGVIEAELGHHAAALAHVGAAEQAWAGKLGPDHPNFLAARSLRGRVARDTGDLATARAHFEAVLAIKRQNYGPDGSEALTLELELAQTLAVVGEPDALEEALALARHVVEQRRKKLAAKHSRIGEALFELAAIELRAGQIEAAGEHLAEAEEILAAVFDEGHPRLVALARVRAELEGAVGGGDASE
jgi:tetratricopeptide (TPR) repeat protein